MKPEQDARERRGAPLRAEPAREREDQDCRERMPQRALQMTHARTASERAIEHLCQHQYRPRLVREFVLEVAPRQKLGKVPRILDEGVSDEMIVVVVCEVEAERRKKRARRDRSD